MANKAKFQAIKGTRDLLPPETELWNRVEQTAREVFGTFGFGEIRPPIFEPTELFARAIGLDTDVVSKEMYTFPDKPGALPDFLNMPPADVVLLLKEKMHTGEINQDEGLIARLEFELANYEARLKENNSTSAQLLWGHFIGGLPVGESLALRPEATASVCRAYIERGMQQWPAPVKLYYMGPMFRRERPQKGRYRQFYQIGAEVLGGTDAPGIDAEVIEMVMAFFERLELQSVQLEINSIGHSAPNCRRGYVEKLKAALVEVKDKLGADSQRRIATNPLRVLDSKLEHEQVIIEKLPRITDSLCDECKSHYAELKRQLDLRSVKYRENWRLVRGLDYYMRTTFEITAKGLGSQNAVCGGGRYDGLVELLGGPPTKGIGFAIGEDRLVLSLLEAGKDLARGEWRAASRQIGFDVYVAWMGRTTEATAIAAARKLRESGLRVELPAVEQKFGKALGQADKLGAKFALILGEDEVASGQWTVKNLADGGQEKVSGETVVEFLKRKK
jgi:histidyl-tRNA synthetase